MVDDDKDNDEWGEFDRWLSNIEWMTREVRRFQAIGHTDRAEAYLQHIAWTINERISNEDG